MAKNIQASTGRSIMAGLVVVAFVVTTGVLLWLGQAGAMTQGNRITTLQLLLKFYAPLFGILLAFYVAEKGQRPKSGAVSMEATVVSGAMVGLWVLVPTVALLTSDSVEAAREFVETFQGYGDALGSGGLAYFFSKSA